MSNFWTCSSLPDSITDFPPVVSICVSKLCLRGEVKQVLHLALIITTEHGQREENIEEEVDHAGRAHVAEALHCRYVTLSVD